MEASRNCKSLSIILLLGTLTASLVPTQLVSMETTVVETVVTPSVLTKFMPYTSAQPDAHSKLIIKIAIVASFAAVLLMCSENARTLTCKAYYKSILAALHILQSCPLPKGIQERIAAQIEQVETLYATRTGDSFTSEKLRALLKEFKDLWDVVKAGKEFCGLIKNPTL